MTSFARGASVAALLLTAAGSARADDPQRPAVGQGEAWCVLVQAAAHVPEGTVETYRVLLEGEIAARLHPRLVSTSLPEDCRDAPCARAAAAAAGAETLALGGISPLGSHFIATVQVIDARSGDVRESHRVTLERIEELDVAAPRMARAIATGQSVEDSATLGTITQKEERPDRRRQGAGGAALHFLGSLPVGTGLAPSVAAVGFGLGYWAEFRRFSIEPRIGLRFSTQATGGGYQHLPIDLGANFILSDDDLAPFVGGALGVHFLHQWRNVDVVSGSVLQTTSTTTIDSTLWGPGLTARAGLLLFRTYTVRLSVALEYSVVIGSATDLKNPQNAGLSTGVIF